MKQLQAGYIIESIEEYLSKRFGKNKVSGLLNQLSYFDADIDSSVSNDIENREQVVFYVANNIISRGLPTRMSLSVENRILDTFGITNLNEKHASIGSIKHDLDFSIFDRNTKDDFGEKLYRSLCKLPLFRTVFD